MAKFPGQDMVYTLSDLCAAQSVRLTAADALAEKIKQYENDRDFYIPQGIIDALREYEATK